VDALATIRPLDEHGFFWDLSPCPASKPALGGYRHSRFVCTLWKEHIFGTSCGNAILPPLILVTGVRNRCGTQTDILQRGVCSPRSKFAASFRSSVPLYFVTDGYAQSRLVLTTVSVQSTHRDFSITVTHLRGDRNWGRGMDAVASSACPFSSWCLFPDDFAKYTQEIGAADF
jgi:hypothetical protein